MEGKKLKARASFGGSASSPQPPSKMPRQAPRTGMLHYSWVARSSIIWMWSCADANARSSTTAQPTCSCFAAPAKGRLVHEDVDRDISFKKLASSVGSAGGVSSKKGKRKSTAVGAQEADFEKTFGLVGHGFGGDLSLDDGKEALEDDDAFGASAGSGSDSENEELAAAQLEASKPAARKRNNAVASTPAAAPIPAASSKKTAQASVTAPTTSAAKPARPSSASALPSAAAPAASKGKKAQTASKAAIAPASSDSEEDGGDSAPSGAAASAARTGGAASAGKHGALVAGKVAFAIDSAASSGKGKPGAVPPPQQPKTALFDSDEEEEEADAEEEDVEAASSDEGSGEGVTDEDEDEEEEENSSDEEGDGGDDEFSGGDIIAAQRRMDKRAARIAEESAAEMRLNIASGEAAADLFMLPSAGELAEERAGPPNLAVVKKRVEEVIGELAVCVLACSLACASA